MTRFLKRRTLSPLLDIQIWRLMGDGWEACLRPFGQKEQQGLNGLGKPGEGDERKKEDLLFNTLWVPGWRSSTFRKKNPQKYGKINGKGLTTWIKQVLDKDYCYSERFCSVAQKNSI